ncbi:MAG: hypothetical protein HXY26_11495 [Hydrogenophilaceae bacterium]|nr:hypothetical protein [Hydrogenophilaceae bacterium]
MTLQLLEAEPGTADYKRALAEANRHIERLKSLWRLVTSRDSTADPIDAMLALAAEALNMDVAAVGDFSDVYTSRYAYDKVGILPVGSTFPISDTLCHYVQEAKGPVFVEDLT